MNAAMEFQPMLKKLFAGIEGLRNSDTITEQKPLMPSNFEMGW